MMHGIRSTYTHGGCRCEACRKANTEHEKRRVRRNAYGRNPLVDAERARKHVRSLMASAPGNAAEAVGVRRIAEVSGVTKAAIDHLLYGKPGRRTPNKRIFRETEAKLLAVTRKDMADGTAIDAAETKRMVEEMVASGITRYRIARALGRSSGRLDIYEMVRISTFKAISALHWSLWRRSGEFRMRCGCDLPAEVEAWLKEEV